MSDKNSQLRYRKQDKSFPDETMYVAVFFPKIEGMKAKCPAYCVHETAALTANKAKAKFLATTIGGWKKYHTADWQIRKIKVTDMGPA